MAKAGTKGVARAERERQILDIAGQVFGDTGFAGTSLARIAARAGISKPLIYNYFGSKEGLFTACLTWAGDTLTEVIDTTASLGYVGPQRAIVTFDGVFAALQDRTWMWRLVHDRTMPAELTARYEHYHQRMNAVAAEGVRELLNMAGNDDPLDISALTTAWINVFDALVTWWIEHPDQSRAAMTERTIRLFTTIFGPFDAGTPPAAVESATSPA